MILPAIKPIPRPKQRGFVFWAFFSLFACVLIKPGFLEAQTVNWPLVWGSETGLYGRDQTGRVETLWLGGNVKKVIQVPTAPGRNERWVILTGEGILVSENLRNWEKRNQGLPETVVKIFENGKKSFVSMPQDIKSLSLDPQNPDIMVCAVKNSIFLSRTAGRSWQNLSMPSYQSNGIKAVLVSAMEGSGLTVFCSHSIYGVYYINPDLQDSKWTEISTGLEKLETTNNPDEVSSFVVFPNQSNNQASEIYASMSFRRRLYKLDWAQKEWILVSSDGQGTGTIDSLFAAKNSLFYVRDGGIMELGLSTASSGLTSSARRNTSRLRQDIFAAIGSIPENNKAACAVLQNMPGETGTICLSELWLLSAGRTMEIAVGKEGLYLPVNHAMDPGSLRPYLNVIERSRLNMVVIDMKDDYGRLRFNPTDPETANLGRVFRPVDLSVFLKTMKERNIYTVARIVVFKDPEAAAKLNGKYAVWDRQENKAWEGYYDTRRRKPLPGQEPEINPALRTEILPDSDREYEILRTWYDEKWVDPFSEEIWDYNASIAEDLWRQGFDEIQFDYIRFPTDGVNLRNASYRWRDAGMDMDGAILSFLRHVRARIKAPISVDIYGANGWYRTGARTGQEVELLAPWVDIICPMYYPSHFEQDFLAQDPPEFRPYRIYYQGTLRTAIIARGQVIVRPWAQAFYLNVSYDRKYYDNDYVRRQLEGTRAAGNGGLTYWNNGGRYDDIP